jgi:hypothetical protein
MRAELQRLCYVVVPLDASEGTARSKMHVRLQVLRFR